MPETASVAVRQPSETRSVLGDAGEDMLHVVRDKSGGSILGSLD
jgi:hypothetical protein